MYRDQAYEGLQRIIGRIDKWKEYQEKSIAGIVDNKARVKARENLERDHAKRVKEVNDILKLFTEGGAILQQLIVDGQENYSTAYNRGFVNGQKQKKHDKYRYGNNREAYRAAHMVDTIKALPNLF